MIIVSGATGFIGTYLVDSLIKNDMEVLAIGNKAQSNPYFLANNVPYCHMDLSNEDDFEKLPTENVDAFVHLGGLLSIDIWKPTDYFRVNTLGTRNVLEYCRKNGIGKVIYSMTHSDVNRSNEVVISEKTPQLFAGGRGFARSYIISKIAAMQYVDCYTREYDIHGVNLRFPGVRGYGGRFISFWNGQPQISAFYMFIYKALRGLPIEIWGNHETKRDLVYVKDVVGGIEAALKSKNAKGLYNIGTGYGLTIEDEAKAIVQSFCPLKNPSELVYRPDVEEVEKRSYIFDISKARKELGYSPKYTYFDAMMDYKLEMDSGKFNHLIKKQEDVLMAKCGLNIDQLIRNQKWI